jgi:hypothetical protein
LSHFVVSSLVDQLFVLSTIDRESTTSIPGLAKKRIALVEQHIIMSAEIRKHDRELVLVADTIRAGGTCADHGIDRRHRAGGASRGGRSLR